MVPSVLSSLASFVPPVDVVSFADVDMSIGIVVASLEFVESTIDVVLLSVGIVESSVNIIVSSVGVIVTFVGISSVVLIGVRVQLISGTGDKFISSLRVYFSPKLPVI